MLRDAPNDGWDMHAQVQPNYAEPQTVKAYNEILRAFECICRVFSDRLLSFLFQKLEDNNEDARAGCLGVPCTCDSVSQGCMVACAFIALHCCGCALSG